MDASLPEPLPKVYLAPEKITEKVGRSVFLAGSIEMGKADNWQPRLTERLRDVPCTIFNPRRHHWDTTWEQRKTNPNFSEQVNWELDRLHEADVIAMYFDPKTTSPITLLELGLHAADGADKLVLCCPDGYYRLGNVEVVCERHNIPVLGSFDELVEEVKERLQK
ncbi:hypothetical protein LXA43DRAFT_885676 [Ganoderma leucocontextum]|nr:hypothetical protein LXA43DRAFT_885676 [Ganoderma leucocontextum]